MKSFRTLFLTMTLGLFLVIGCSGNGDEAKADQTAQKGDQQMAQTDMSDSTKGAPAKGEMRNPNDPIVTLETSMGNLTLELYRDVAPAHVDSFIARTKDGFYSNQIFHRVIDHFMIQGGDPKGNGTGNAGYFLPAEFSNLPHMEGTLSMARSTDPNSASSQFFICLERNRATEGLDGKYTVFGQLLKGYDVLHKIGSVEVEANPLNPREISKPVEDVKLIRAYMSDADGNPL